MPFSATFAIDMNTNTLRILVAVAAICTTLACSQKTGKLLPTDLPTDSVSIDTLVYLDANRTAKLTFHIGYQLFADSAMAAANSAVIASDSTLLDYQDSLSLLSPRQAIATFAKKYCDDYRQYANLIRAQERDSLSRLNWDFSLDSKLMRGRDGNIVVLQQLKVFEGGLSATEYTFARNIEPKSLKLLSLNDLFTADDRKDLTADFVRQLTGMYDCDGLDQLRQKDILVDTEPYLSTNFYITDRNITFIYAPGEIAPAAEGEIQVTVEL